MPAGVSNNPKGRPPKNRALTEILEKAGATQLDINGNKVSRKRLLASLLWEAATTGRVTFDDRVEMCNVDQWLGIAKFIYTQVDGAPRQNVELTGADGGPIQTQQIFEHGNVAAAIASRSSGYSVPPSED